MCVSCVTSRLVSLALALYYLYIFLVSIICMLSGWFSLIWGSVVSFRGHRCVLCVCLCPSLPTLSVRTPYHHCGCGSRFPSRRDNRLTPVFEARGLRSAVYDSVKAKDDGRVYRSLLAPTNVLGSVVTRRCHCVPGHP